MNINMLLYGRSILREKSCNQLGGHMFCPPFIINTAPHWNILTQEQAVRVRACNSVNLKPGRIIEPLLKMWTYYTCVPGLAIKCMVHSDQPVRHGYGRVRSVGAFIAFPGSKSLHGVRMRRWLCSCTWPGVLFLVTVQQFCLDYGLLLVTRSYSNCPFLCVLD